MRSIAVLKSAEGFHKSALRNLENLEPLIKHVEPRLYYDFLNSYAIELGEASRKDEDRNISRIVLASPFAYAYPEWQDTANDLRGSQKSFAVIRPTRIRKAKLLRMSHVERNEPTTVGRLAPVITLQDWKEKMAKKKQGTGDKPTDEMDLSAMMIRSMNVFSDLSISDEKKRRMIFAIEKILAEPEKPTSDDDDGA